MAIYRLDLDRTALLQLLGGTTLLGTLLFFSGTLVGYSASGGGSAASASPEGASEALAAAPPAVGFASRNGAGAGREETICPVLPGAAETTIMAGARAADAGSGGDGPAIVDPTRATTAAVHEILAPRAGPDDASRWLATATSGRYAVQVGAFSVRGNADALAARLRERGYDPLIVTARSRSGRWVEYVHLSLHPQERAAQLVAGEFTLREQLPAIVVAVTDDGGAQQ